MGIHLIIDGYNFIRQSPELAVLDRQDLAMGREALVAQLAAYKKVKPHRITVVFDGTLDPSIYGSKELRKGIAIRYSHGGERADDVIRRMARKEGARALVISSDREVMVAAEAAGADAMGSPEFEKKLLMVRDLDRLGSATPDDSVGWTPTTRKKGPRRRLSKKKRKERARFRKL